MNIKAILLILLTQLIVAHCNSPRTPNKPSQMRKSETRMEWGAATYRGLTVGKSTAADVLRILGEPKWSGPPGDQREDDPNPEIWNEYEIRGDFSGKLTVVIDKRSRIIQAIQFDPTNVSEEQGITYFGRDYIKTRYDFDECLSNGESAPLYESPNGQFVSIEYRDRGIAIAVNEQRMVRQISYVSKPIGAPSSRCKNR